MKKKTKRTRPPAPFTKEWFAMYIEALLLLKKKLDSIKNQHEV